MAVTKVQKIDDEYVPALRSRNSALTRIVKYFKGVSAFSDLKNPESRLYNMLKSVFLSSRTYTNSD